MDEDNRIKMKGKVACEIKTQEILLTELIFNNLFSNLEPEVIAAILSVVVFEQKRCSEPNLNSKLKEVRVGDEGKLMRMMVMVMMMICTSE